MPEKRKVKCYLCGNLFNIEAPTNERDVIATLYYCEKCSEQKVDIRCGNCGKIFQELPIKENETERIASLCEECSRMIADIVLNPKQAGSKRQKDIISKPARRGTKKHSG